MSARVGDWQCFRDSFALRRPAESGKIGEVSSDD